MGRPQRSRPVQPTLPDQRGIPDHRSRPVQRSRPGQGSRPDQAVVLEPVRHRRPVRTFRAIGVFVLVVGAISGVYLGLNRTDGVPRSLDASGAPTSATADSVQDKAVALAQAKAAAAAVEAAARAEKANEVAERDEAASRSQPRTSYPVPTSCKEYTGNRALGCALLLSAGFGLEEMPCLEKLWTKESGWNHKSENKSSGAYGIPQALPGSKMAAYGADWETNPVPQIKWGLNYIENRYKTPCGAWSFFQTHNWY